jgi:2'-5' RNA ligase
MTRVFSAVEIEDDSVLDELERVRDLLDHDFSPVPREKMHITLQFFPDLSDEQLDSVKKALKDVEMEEFEIQVRGVGAFPSHEYIRVVWAGAEEKKLRELREQVVYHPVEDQDREFKPHVTLFRVENIQREQKRKLRRALRDFSDHVFGTQNVESVKLFESKMTENGSEYHVIEEKQLDGN